MKQSICIAFLFFIFGCNNQESNNTKKAPDSLIADVDSIPSVSSKVDKDTVILKLANQVLTSLKNKDYRQFAALFHPVAGVRFSPYGYIDTAHDVKLTAEKFLSMMANGDKANWGSFDGSGDPILLDVRQYFKKFVYNADFLYPEKMNLNKTTKSGNSLNNLETIYSGCEFTESYFSGFDKKYGGMDWTSLTLVFKSYNNLYYLVGIVHGQWTI